MNSVLNVKLSSIYLFLYPFLIFRLFCYIAVACSCKIWPLNDLWSFCAAYKITPMLFYLLTVLKTNRCLHLWEHREKCWKHRQFFWKYQGPHEFQDSLKPLSSLSWPTILDLKSIWGKYPLTKMSLTPMT